MKTAERKQERMRKETRAEEEINNGTRKGEGQKKRKAPKSIEKPLKRCSSQKEPGEAGQ